MKLHSLLFTFIPPIFEVGILLPAINKLKEPYYSPSIPVIPLIQIGVALAGATSYIMPLKEVNGFLLDLEVIPKDVRHSTK
ncbi:hypothetical protein [Oceanobacillus senegalensis]|uniref:hypothetical protein n=1 Tax=Oceanobacillus senegalensis TaxID=1936063 RepID=UPI0015C4DB00|nr:hypothetical protein [Oceanobacillus senegalensis]